MGATESGAGVSWSSGCLCESDLESRVAPCFRRLLCLFTSSAAMDRFLNGSANHLSDGQEDGWCLLGCDGTKAVQLTGWRKAIPERLERLERLEGLE